MSCEVKLLSVIDDLSAVQEYFGLSTEENWLNAVSYSLSPVGDVLAFGHGSILVILTSKWDRQRQMNVYKVAWRGAIDDVNCIVTSVLCTPLVGQGQGSQTMVDFSYIIVGLNSGQVLFYGENGSLVHSQTFHPEPIQSIKAQSGKHISEELYVFYPSCAVIVQGSQVFPLLRSLRQQLNRYGAGSPKVNEAHEAIPCRKWSYEKSMTVSDSVVVGPQKTCTFDHLLTASLEGGFFAKYRHAAPQNSLIVGVGMKPYIGFHYAKEGFTQPVLADVARAVASKIKSALPSWLGRSSSVQQQTPPEPQLPPSEPLICRFGLCDLQRNAFGVWLAPNFRLAAVADVLGRIILVDCARGIALRIWKGYREAQCGFVEVKEKPPKEATASSATIRKLDRRKALFLVIYAPRRSVLEVWSLETGPKVAAFTAAKNGQLIYNTHSYMGVTTSGSKIKYSGLGCTFFDPSDCSLKEINIPFHCALSDSKSKMAKDLHLLKRLKICLRSGDGNEAEELQEMTEMCCSFETDEIKQQCIEMLSKQRKIRPQLFAMVVDVFAGAENDNDNDNTAINSGEEEDVARSHLKIICMNYRKLVKFYQFLNESAKVPSGGATNAEDEQPTTKDKLSESVRLSEQELASIEKLIELLRMNEPEVSKVGAGTSTTRVTFEESAAKGSAFMEYLSSFNVSNEELILLKDDSPLVYSSLGKIVFEDMYRQRDDPRLEGLAAAVDECGLMHEDLLKMFLAYWLRQPFTYHHSVAELFEDLHKFSRILNYICCLAKEKIRFENNRICLWWQSVREYLLESPCALRGLLAAIMCRNEGLKFETHSDDEDYQFVEVTQEACQWTLLIGKLDDVAVLGTILAECLKCNDAIWPCLRYQKPAISLKEILKGGKGIVTELVAKWVSATGIDPEKLVIEVPEEATEKVTVTMVKPEANEKKERKRLELIKEDLLQTSEYGGSSESEVDPVIYNLNILRRHFPFSLDSGNLLSHLVWEYICDWSKNMSNISCLKAGLACLRAIPRLQFSIKHGLCCMVWNAHLKIPLEATKKLVNKVGRLPKEKLCLQDIGISDALVPQFLECCLEFFEHFAGSIDHDKIELRFEELLQDGPISLTALTVQQNSANMALLKLHHELTTVLLVLTSFNVKYQKPVQHLFDGMAYQSFFAEINRQLPYSLPKPDLLLKKARMDFLRRTVTASMDLIREDLENVFYTDHNTWMETIAKLAETWELEIGEIRKHQIIELYAHGWDSYAEELLENVVADNSFGNLLLSIAGRRLALYTKSNPTAWGQIATVGPLLTDYLDALASNESQAPGLRFAEGNEAACAAGDVYIEKLTKLTAKAFQALSGAGQSPKTKELRVAGLLFDACATVKDQR